MMRLERPADHLAQTSEQRSRYCVDPAPQCVKLLAVKDTSKWSRMRPAAPTRFADSLHRRQRTHKPTAEQVLELVVSGRPIDGTFIALMRR
jgi:hypothetical protein